MKIEKIIKITRYKCDFCKKQTPYNQKVSVGELDFCCSKCFDAYQKQKGFRFNYPKK